MGFNLVILVAITALSLLQILSWYRRKLVAQATLGVVFIVVYFVDLVQIGISRTFFLVPSLGRQLATDPGVLSATLMSVLAWLAYSIGVEVFARVQSARFFQSPLRDVVRTRPAVLLVLFLVSALSVGLAVRDAGLERTFEARQTVFSQGPLELLSYYLLPVLAVVSVLIAVRARSLGRLIAVSIAVVCLGMTFLTGSRSALFLTAVIPLLLYVWRRLQLRAISIGRDIARTFLVLAMVFVPVVGGSYYLANVRGADTAVAANSQSVLGGVDVSQADVLVALAQGKFEQLGGSSYVAAFVSLVPRELWATKPLSGGVEVSMDLSAARYMTTGAEITPGLLGEGFLNFGFAGFLVAAVVLLFFSFVCHRLLAGRGDVSWLLGVILLIRGINLIRGDLTNTIVPVVVTVVAFWLIFSRSRESDYRSLEASRTAVSDIVTRTDESSSFRASDGKHNPPC